MRSRLAIPAKSSIFIYNGTFFDYVLMDLDGNFYGNVKPVSSYSFNLNYSDTFEKEYNLQSANFTISFRIKTNGEIANVTNTMQVNTQIGFAGQNRSLFKKTITLIATDPAIIKLGSPEAGFTHLVRGGGGSIL
jgi:hypothetical protein